MLHGRFMEWMIQDKPAVVTNVNKALDDAKKNMDGTCISELRDKELIKDLNEWFKKYRKQIKKNSTNKFMS